MFVSFTQEELSTMFTAAQIAVFDEAGLQFYVEGMDDELADRGYDYDFKTVHGTPVLYKVGFYS